MLGGTPSAPSHNNRVYIGETEDFWPLQWPFALEGEKQGGSSPPRPSSGLDALGQSVALKWHVFTLACQHVRVPKNQAAVRWPGIGAGNGNRPFEQEAICKSASTLLRLAAIPCFTPMLSFRSAVSHRVLALATAGIRFRNRVLRVLASRCLCDAVSPWEAPTARCRHTVPVWKICVVWWLQDRRISVCGKRTPRSALARAVLYGSVFGFPESMSASLIVSVRSS